MSTAYGSGVSLIEWLELIESFCRNARVHVIIILKKDLKVSFTNRIRVEDWSRILGIEKAQPRWPARPGDGRHS